MVKIDRNGPKWSKMEEKKHGQSGLKWLKTVKNG